MTFARSVRTAGVSALAVLASTTAPQVAQACDIYSYYECAEVGQASDAVSRSLEGAGNNILQQQLNVGAFAAFAAPTGRLRHSEHDGLKVKGDTIRTLAFETDEASVFANGTYDLPGTYFGGKVRVSVLAGYDWLEQDTLTHNTEIDAFIYGGSYLWSQGQFYSMSILIGISGDADTTNTGVSYSYDVSGYYTNSIIGYTFNLNNGLKFDLRGNLGHSDVETSTFVIPTTVDFVKGSSEAWHAGLTGTLFTIVETGGGVLRPYVLAAYKNVFDEDIESNGSLGLVAFEQANDYGKIEGGFDFVQGNITYGAAIYGEFSSDEETIGGRLGMSVKLQ